jgi:hypothetical protein
LHHFGRSINWFKPQTKEKSPKESSWFGEPRGKLRSKITKWQINAKPTMHHFGRKFNWFKPQTKEKSSKESSWFGEPRCKLRSKTKKSGKSRLNLHCTILEGNSIGSNHKPKKRAQTKESSWFGEPRCKLRSKLKDSFCFKIMFP